MQICLERRNVCAQARPVHRRRNAVCCAAQVPVADRYSSEATTSSRRVVLQLASALISFSILPINTPSAQAGVSTSGLCSSAATEDEDRDCRRQQLESDGGRQEKYGEVSERKLDTAGASAVAVLDAEYTQATLALGDKIEQYFTIDVYDKSRIALIKSLKLDASTWVSKYARGGSARSQSARKFYVAVDSVMGHLASNGLAPFPDRKQKLVREEIAAAKTFLPNLK